VKLKEMATAFLRRPADDDETQGVARLKSAASSRDDCTFHRYPRRVRHNHFSTNLLMFLRSNRLSLIQLIEFVLVRGQIVTNARIVLAIESKQTYNIRR
jgi:hypothetical protein